MNNLKKYFLLINYLLTIGSILITSIILNEYHQYVLSIIIFSIVISPILIIVIKYPSKFKHNLFNYLILIYQISSTIFIIYAFLTLTNTYHYLSTPIIHLTIVIYLTILIITKLDYLKALDMITIIMMCLSIILIIATIYQPKPNLVVSFNIPIHWLIPFVYLQLIIEMMIFNQNNNKEYQINKIQMIVIIMITLLSLLFYAFKDLSIVSNSMFYSLFPNIIKYRIFEHKINLHLDLIYLGSLLISLILKFVIYHNYQSNFKAFKNKFIHIIFLSSIFLIITSKNDYLTLKVLLFITTILSILIIITGGIINGFSLLKKFKK